MKRFVVRLLILGLVVFLLFFAYLRFGAYIFIDKDERTTMLNRISSAPKLPDRFYQLYQVVHPNTLTTGLSENILRETIDATLGEHSYKVREVPSYNAVFICSYSWGIKRLQLIYYVEDQTSQQQCLNLVAQQTDFLFGNIGAESASLHYFSKSLEQLNDEELLSLIVMMQNPGLYNPVKRPYLLKSKVDYLLKIAD